MDETRSVESMANYHHWMNLNLNKCPWINLSCNPIHTVLFRLLFSRVHSPFIHFRKENELRSLHFIHFYSAKHWGHCTDHDDWGDHDELWSRTFSDEHVSLWNIAFWLHSYDNYERGRRPIEFSLNMRIFSSWATRSTDRPTDRPWRFSASYIFWTKLPIDKRFSASESHVQ